MNKSDVSRRKFLGRTGSLALALPLAAAIPAAIEAASPIKAEAASAEDDQQKIPNRVLPTRSIGTATVTVSGLPTNGTSDCSAIIQSAINGLGASGGTVIIPFTNTGGKSCVYMVDTTANLYSSSGTNHYYGILLKSNVRIQFKPGVKLQAMPNSSARAYILFGHEIHDVEIANGGLVGERYTHTPSGTGTDEWCHGIQLLGVTGITIRGTLISDCTGDGICIGSINGTAPSDNVFCDVVSTGNRRQGLSITSGDSISVYDSEFSYTSGTAPGDGIDIEPQGTASVSNVTIENCILRGNAADGIELNASGTNISNLTVNNCLFSSNYNGFAAANSNNGVIDIGTLYGNAFFQNANYGLQLGGTIGTVTHYTVGTAISGGPHSNSFANNRLAAHSTEYPDLTQTDTNGYIAGTDMNLSPNSLLSSSGNLIHWNSYFTP